MKRTGPWQSKLIPFEKEIYKMWRGHTKLLDIQKYLEKKNIKMSVQGIGQFLRIRHTTKNPRSECNKDEVNIDVLGELPIKPKSIISNPDKLLKKSTEEKWKELKEKPHADPLKGLVIKKQKGDIENV